jgi:hypothetical protein
MLVKFSKPPQITIDWNFSSKKLICFGGKV